MAQVLKESANFFAGVRVVTLLAGDLAAGIRNSPYRSAGMAAVLGALAGIALAHRSPRTIPTRD
ncbi:MAG TPA: hypothetical protein VHS76_01695 [Steroidobacteraceae bacterium]|nr:hypothetical protein [Steroidobacteraceae bacterium]